jgi:hypothetical protein
MALGLYQRLRVETGGGTEAWSGSRGRVRGGQIVEG